MEDVCKYIHHGTWLTSLSNDLIEKIEIGYVRSCSENSTVTHVSNSVMQTVFIYFFINKM